MKRLIGSLQIMILLGYLVSCTSTTSIVIPTPTISSTSTTIPTITETSTPFPTNTPLPSVTPACQQPDSQVILNSVQEKTAILVPGAGVTWYDNFNCQDLSYGWVDGNPNNPTMKIVVSKSIVTISAKKVEKTWDGITRTTNSLGDNKGFLVLFRYQERTDANLFFHTGTWQTPDYRRWGLTTINGQKEGSWVGWHGSIYLSSYFPSNVLRSNVWYYLLGKLDKSGQVTMKIWEKENPTNHADFQKVMQSNWIGHRWQFLVQVYDGTVEIDEYQELSFDTP